MSYMDNMIYSLLGPVVLLTSGAHFSLSCAAAQQQPHMQSESEKDIILKGQQAQGSTAMLNIQSRQERRTAKQPDP
jgi:hypothetical protein